MRFQAPQLGALGVTFTAFRAMQSASLIAIIGMTANFINDIVTSERDTPDVLVGTLTVGYAGARGNSGKAAITENPVSDFGIPKQYSRPTALGTRLLATKGPDRWIPPPQPARRPPIIRQVDEDARSARMPHVVVNANSGPAIVTGQHLDSNINISAPAPAVVPTDRSFNSFNSSEDYIPIAHNPSYDGISGKKRGAHNPIAVAIPPTPSDDGFTPITPTPASPEVRDYRLSRAPPLPRDALGIPVGKFFARAKSNKVQIQYEDDDAAPLSPKSGRDLEAQAITKPKPKRKTLWGVIEGWWDLGLLERGKSLRRKA
ncbi:hypothetical protein Daesc_008923 [Daldinia eschscholtzii]|uniref:Uncharacterized protein n=1 Tax=Daldinia eschscholtzii TaxID=292717 RepID=A0AAX6M9H4_9PEZI